MFRSAKPIRIQPINPILINIGKIAKKNPPTQYRTVGRYVHWQILTDIGQILTNIVSFYKNGHFSEKHVVFHSENLGCGQLGALICFQYASVCIHTHPHASIRLIYTYIKSSKIESLNSCSPQAARIQSSILISAPAVAHAYKKKPKSNGPIKRPIWFLRNLALSHLTSRHRILTSRYRI